MSQCRGKSANGNRCRKAAGSNSHYCHIHSSQDKQPSKWPIAIGAGIGYLIFPGIGGIVGGGLAGNLFVEGKNISKTRVFISFDYDHDSALKDFFVGQSKLTDSPFEIADHSIKQHISGDWKAKARKRIRNADIVCFICGQDTHTAAGVNTELSIAKAEGTPYFFLQGYRDKKCTKPKGAQSSDRIHRWTWKRLKQLLGNPR